jgi:hypothetical protein
VVLAEQGIGDFVQFARYLPMLKARGARVVCWPPAGLGSFAARMPGIDVVLAEGDRVPEHDYYAFMLSLPRVFGTRLDAIPPPTVPALAADPATVKRWSHRFAERDAPRVGIVWAGRPEHGRDRQRSIPLAELETVLRVPGVRFVGLQKGPAASQVGSVPEHVAWENAGPECEDLDDAMAVIARLDLLVTVDTGLAHLAAAMGKPVWMLVANPPDFRWLIDGDDSPWYPTIRLFRQAAPGDWAPAVRAVADALAQWTRDWHGAVASSSLPPPAPLARPMLRRATVEARVPHLARALPMRHGFLQYDPDERDIGAVLESDGEWLEARCALMVTLAKPGDTVVVAHPGVGAHALPLARRLGSDGHLIAFEPRVPLRHILVHNLAAHAIGNATVLARHLGRTSGDRPGSDTDAVDDLQLASIHGIVSGESGASRAIVDGADATLWNARPWVVLAVEDDGPAVASAVESHGYRCWRLETPMRSPANFNRRVVDPSDRRVAVALVAIPEERATTIVVDGCREWR